MSIDELVQAANRLNEPDLDQLIDRVMVLRAKRKSPILSQAETELLLVINEGIPPDLHQRYQTLVEKRNAETLTEEEYQVLLDLSDRIEVLAAQRAAALLKLAELRQITLMQLMDDLGIQAPSYA
jgi:hypothetical protein